MLETRDLCKTYKPKKGVPVQALCDVSLRFPDHGMVFLLGKSGSGKSTLLNVLGGLDRYDSGEIIIKGVSSRDFRQQHFDSYRNTYVGFIFQEYNVLEEFTVGANIALAIELQGRRADDAQINAILEQVDLAGYGSRKPNELSGGQKQRVAIARALVKNPEIIMADEPTGALDSVTGRQVLDTLKKLSADKLVLVVSHDREFAEKYADRIIELADGRVIRDVEYSENAEQASKTGGLRFGEAGVTVPAAYRLTEEDRLAINAYLEARQNGETVLQLEQTVSRQAVPTDESRITWRAGETFRLIKSRLPMKSAFKIGASGLKYKKFRLVITILLSCIAFGLFGLSDTFGAYDHVETCTTSLIDSHITYASVEKTVRRTDNDGNAYYVNGYRLDDADIATIKEQSGVEMVGVLTPRGADLSFDGQYDTSATFTETDYHIYASEVIGFAEVTGASLENMGHKLIAGRLPQGDQNEIAVSAYVCETFKIGGYAAAPGEPFVKIKEAADMVGRVLTIDGREYTVTGIVDTGCDIERYRPLTVKKENQSTSDELVEYALYREWINARCYSLNQVAMVGEGFVKRMVVDEPRTQEATEGYLYFYSESASGEYCGLGAPYYGTVDCVQPEDIVWLDGVPRTALGEKELVISWNAVSLNSAFSEPEDLAALTFSGEKIIYSSAGDDNVQELEGYTVVGYMPDVRDTILAHPSLFEGIFSRDNGIYSFAVGPMPDGRAGVHRLVTYCYGEEEPVRFELQNPVCYELDMVHEVLAVLAKVFLYIGIGFAVFAALMLGNFIGTSIAYKKQEIGILRAIGSRGNDVFRIFFSESFIIAMINFVLSVSGVAVATAVINRVIRTDVGALITVLRFGPRQVLLLFAVSLLVAAVGSFLPVRRIAAKLPIDAIRNR